MVDALVAHFCLTQTGRVDVPELATAGEAYTVSSTSHGGMLAEHVLGSARGRRRADDPLAPHRGPSTVVIRALTACRRLPHMLDPMGGAVGAGVGALAPDGLGAGPGALSGR